MLAAGVLAADGKLNIVAVSVLGFVLTVAGANLTFSIGRKVGPQVFTRPGPFVRHRKVVLSKTTPIVQRFGWLAAFATRFVFGLRECGALLLGALGMTWKEFLLWNTPGGLAWALSHALLGYYLGRTFGVSGAIIAIAVISLAAVGLAVFIRRLRAARVRSRPQMLPVAEEED